MKNEELNRLSYYIDELRSDDKIDYDVYLNLREMSDQLENENAALREKTFATERAFRNFLAEYLTAVNEQNSYNCGIPEMFGRYVNVLPYEDIVTSRLNEYLEEAEKELAEEGKNG